jgi:hypothetical protein
MLDACVGAAGTNECMVAKLLLVHSPLVGCATWELVAADLAGRGHEVGIPDLTGTVMAGPPYCLRQAEVIARSASGRPAGCPRLPLAMFGEVHPPVPRWPDAPAAYLQLSEAYEDQAAKARQLGWPVTRQMSHHLALLTEPGLVAGSVHELLGRLRR